MVTSLLFLSSTASNAVQDFFLSFVNQDADTRKENQNVKRKNDIGSARVAMLPTTTCEGLIHPQIGWEMRDGQFFS